MPIHNEPCLYLQIAGHQGPPVISWIFRYRTAAGKQVTHTIGRWPEVSWDDVRTRVKILRAEATKGKRLDPTRQEKQAESLRQKAEILSPTPAPPEPTPSDTTQTIKTVAEEFYQKHVLIRNKPSHQKNQRWMLDKYVIPKLGALKITELTPQVATRFLGELVTTPTLANRVKALMSKMANWSGRRFEVLEGVTNPIKGYERHQERPRERRMTEAEIVNLGMLYRQTREPLQTAAIFLLLTGASPEHQCSPSLDSQNPWGAPILNRTNFEIEETL